MKPTSPAPDLEPAFFDVVQPGIERIFQWFYKSPLLFCKIIANRGPRFHKIIVLLVLINTIKLTGLNAFSKKNQLFSEVLPAIPAQAKTKLVSQDPYAKIEPAVMQKLASTDQVDFFIWMTEKANLDAAQFLQTKLEKGNFVYQTLLETASRTQKELRNYLDEQGVSYRPFYISNKILVRAGDQELVEKISQRQDVFRITANHSKYAQEIDTAQKISSHSPEIEANIRFIKADAVWTLGYRGQGSVLANNDTGMDWDHPALISQYRGWDGVSVDHNYNWWDATGTYPTTPNDGHGHGTRTSGTMVGSDSGDNNIGVAPDAQLIHCKNMDDTATKQEDWFIECFEWDLAPWNLSYTGPGTGQPRPDLAPDAVNNSWGMEGGNDLSFSDEISALRAAGIVVEASAGNEGPACSSLRSPGDYAGVLTTGAIDHTSGSFPGTLWSFSSRGPSPFYANGYTPDVMAPGIDIRSSFPGGGYYQGGAGTSAAGAHVTGLVGLILSANPELRGHVAEIEQIITQTAVPLSGQTGSLCGGDYLVGPNHDWGSGTIDSLAAINLSLVYTFSDEYNFYIPIVLKSD